MPTIEVRDADGTLLQTYEIIAEEYGTLITNDHLFEMAKRNLVDDELVSEDRVDELILSVAD